MEIKKVIDINIPKQGVAITWYHHKLVTEFGDTAIFKTRKPQTIVDGDTALLYNKADNKYHFVSKQKKREWNNYKAKKQKKNTTFGRDRMARSSNAHCKVLTTKPNGNGITYHKCHTPGYIIDYFSSMDFEEFERRFKGFELTQLQFKQLWLDIYEKYPFLIEDNEFGSKVFSREWLLSIFKIKINLKELKKK